jgi:hypothetical protein
LEDKDGSKREDEEMEGSTKSMHEERNLHFGHWCQKTAKDLSLLLIEVVCMHIVTHWRNFFRAQTKNT